MSVAAHAASIALVVISARQGPPASGVNAVPVQAAVSLTQPVPTTRKFDGPIFRPPPDAIQSQRDLAAQIRERAPDLTPVEEAQATPPEPEPEPEPEPPNPVEAMATVPPPPPAEPPEETLEAEARRLFGRPKLATHAEMPGQVGARVGAIADRSTPAERSCVPKPRNTGAQVEMAELIGRIWFDEAHTRPLAGAYLQMVGTPYATYSDANGRYRLLFDASLVDECRTQYVRVVAAGYSGKNLVLGLGPGVNDIVMGR